MSMDAALDTFIAEAQELIEVMESVLLRMGEGEQDSETLNEIFRAAHTIKGSAGLFGLSDIVAFTHKVENVLDRARDGEITISTELLDILLNCGDHIALLVNALVEGKNLDADQISSGEQLLIALSPWLNEETEKQSSEEGVIGTAVSGCWHISVKLSQDCLRNGMEPISIIRFLETMGAIKYLVTLDAQLPELENYDPESLYLSYEIGLETDSDKTAIEDAFMFVQEGAHITILPPDSAIEKYVELINSSENKDLRLGEMLVECGALSQDELDQALAEQGQQEVKANLGDILVEHKAVPPTVVDAALKHQKNERAQATRYIRVDAERLDQLINLIGELVVSRQRVDLLAQDQHSPELHEAISGMGGFTEQIRDAALNLRMVQIGETFQRFKRVVRDTAAELGKDIQLVLEGAETELDRSMVEKLTDPLTHIVRNSIDHGIEPAEYRQNIGKPPQGKLLLSACHDAGNIVIEVSDDGGGLNTEKIRNKAIENGVIDEAQQLTEHELNQLIFHAGLSTAEKVTDLSGRGVGMDVVKRNIEALQGNVEIRSVQGEGTTLSIRLPLTLAIIDGFHVVAHGTDFIIPQATILECMDFSAVEHIEGRHSVNIRGELVPYIELKDLFALQGDIAEPEKLVVVRFGNQRAAIVVDVLHGEIQTVVKPLGPIFQSLRGVGGSSLLGNGEIAFILDIPQLIAFAVSHEALETGMREDYT